MFFEKFKIKVIPVKMLLKLRLLIIVTVVAIIALCAFCIFTARNTINFTWDYYHSNFDVNEFSFEFYGQNACSLNEVLSKLIPLGTDKKSVEYILIHLGKAKKRRSPPHLGDNRFTYTYKMKSGMISVMEKLWIVAVNYREDDSVKGVTIGGVSIYEYAAKCNIRKN